MVKASNSVGWTLDFCFELSLYPVTAGIWKVVCVENCSETNTCSYPFQTLKLPRRAFPYQISYKNEGFFKSFNFFIPSCAWQSLDWSTSNQSITACTRKISERTCSKQLQLLFSPGSSFICKFFAPIGKSETRAASKLISSTNMSQKRLCLQAKQNTCSKSLTWYLFHMVQLKSYDTCSTFSFQNLRISCHKQASVS